MLTRKTTYGIRALLGLARSNGESLSVAQLAAQEGIPEHFLSAILSDLRQRGIVRGRRGPDGGYQLSVDPRTLRLTEVVDCLGGPLFPFACLERGKHPAERCNECPGPGRCPAERALGRANEAAYAALESVTVFDLLEGEEPGSAPGARSEPKLRRAASPDDTAPGKTRRS
jgi:Rrf2 family protein